MSSRFLSYRKQFTMHLTETFKKECNFIIYLILLCCKEQGDCKKWTSRNFVHERLQMTILCITIRTWAICKIPLIFTFHLAISLNVLYQSKRMAFVYVFSCISSLLTTKGGSDFFQKQKKSALTLLLTNTAAILRRMKFSSCVPDILFDNKTP